MLLLVVSLPQFPILLGCQNVGHAELPQLAYLDEALRLFL